MRLRGYDRGDAGDIVGREHELAVVEAFVERLEAGPSALVLEGEAGVGKTTLWLAGVADEVLRRRAGAPGGRASHPQAQGRPAEQAARRAP
jgi:hypothetical protein